jgi:hypothetical protein
MIWFFIYHSATGNGDFTFIYKTDFCGDQAGTQIHKVNVRAAYMFQIFTVISTLFSKVSRLPLEPTQHPIQQAQEALSLR